MALERAYIPYGGYWTSPFCRWQGRLADKHSVRLAGEVAKIALAEREIDPTGFDSLFLGTTVPQQHSFYGGPWLAALIGAPGLTGPMLAQACATSARTVASAAFELEAGASQSILCLTCDRTSNGPHLSYPSGRNPGARPDAEDWVWDNFNHDPHARQPMVQTAENVAAADGIDRQAQDEMTLLRHEQYRAARESGFHQRFMTACGDLTEDEGVYPTSAEKLARLEPVLPGGTVTFGSTTYPADGNAGMIVATRERARELSRDPGIEIRILGFGQARAEPGMMARAVPPAAERALAVAEIGIGELAAIGTHNPFAVNDVLFCRTFELPWERLNTHGSPLIYGHPQGPTGMRVTIELIETLVTAGGGYGLFCGCAAGDTAAAVVLRVDVA